MKNNRRNAQNGISVIELLVVLVVVGILVTFAVAQFGNSSSNLERQNITREFKVSLERARFDSVKRRASECAEMSRVEITSPTSFSLITDANQDGVLELATETKTVSFANRSNVQIVGNTSGFPVVFRFDERGHVSSGPCATPVTAVPTTTFCNMPCTIATANAGNSNLVFVSPTGTAAMLTGGETVPDFEDPTVSTVDPDTIKVNPLLAVWDYVSPSPTPTPAVTPTPVPTPTPPAGPTPTPTPTPTSMPACTIGQRPAQDGCECKVPLILHEPSGRCRTR